MNREMNPSTVAGDILGKIIRGKRKTRHPTIVEETGHDVAMALAEDERDVSLTSIGSDTALLEEEKEPPGFAVESEISGVKRPRFVSSYGSSKDRSVSTVVPVTPRKLIDGDMQYSTVFDPYQLSSGKSATSAAVPTKNSLDTLELASLGLGHEFFYQQVKSPLGTAETKSLTTSALPHWSIQYQFTLAALSFCFGIRSIVDVPLNIYLHGRGAFIIIYLLLMTFVTCPLLQVHLHLGQYYQGGMLAVFSCSASAFGIGLAMALGCVMCCAYSSSIMGQAAYYFFMSLFEKMPRSSCQPHGRAQEDCADYDNTISLTAAKISTPSSCPLSPHSNFPSLQLWNHHNSKSPMQWEVAVASLLPWLFIYLVTMRSGGTAYRHCISITAALPLIILFVLVSKVASSVPHADILELFRVSSGDFATVSVWVAAAKCALSQSLLLSGVMISLASFQQQQQQKSTNYSMHSGFMVLTIVIFQLTAYVFVFGLSQCDDITMISELDPAKFAFGVMPELLSHFPRLFLILYFFMVFCCEFGTTITFLECLLTSVEDVKETAKEFRHFSASLLLAAIILLSIVYRGGVETTEPNLIGVITVCWIIFLFLYGADRVAEESQALTGYKPNSRVVLGILVILVFVVFAFLVLQVCSEGRQNWDDYDSALITVMASPIVLYPLLCAVRMKMKGQSLRNVFKVKGSCSAGQHQQSRNRSSLKYQSRAAKLDPRDVELE